MEEKDTSANDNNAMLHNTLLDKIKEMEVAATEMEKAAWIAGAEDTAMGANGAKNAYRAVISLIEK